MANRRRGRLATASLVALGVACSDSGGGSAPVALSCGDLDPVFLADGGVGRDGIPALTNPAFVAAQSPEAGYLTPESRVIAVNVDDEWVAIPHNLMYRHEIVNLDRGDTRVAVTYCPLTGSALAFDRSSLGGAELGVSGLLFQANLIMYDRNAEDSLWPQMAGAAACGPRQGQALERYPVVEMTWAGFTSLFPTAPVVGVAPIDTDWYGFNPYGGLYELASNGDYLGFPIPREDGRRAPKERVLGLPSVDGAPSVAFPFLALAGRGEVWVAEFEYGGEPAAVFWDLARVSAVALRPRIGGQALTFRVENGEILDNETGSTWTVSGESTSGPRSGERLEIIPEAYVAFWLAWAAFNEDSELFIE